MAVSKMIGFHSQKDVAGKGINNWCGGDGSTKWNQ
jgi:hypothetical protein